VTFTLWQWAAAVLGALLVGVAKTGVTGLSLLFVVIFASVMPARESTGVVLPLLIAGDIIAAAAYRRHAQWRHVWRLFPWAALGVFAGAAAIGRMSEAQTRDAIGAIVLALSAIHIARRLRPSDDGGGGPAWFAPLIGVLAGFATIVANASGPLMVIYLLAMRLPKMEYMGTGAIFFLIMNLFKVPFMAWLGLLTPQSLLFDAKLAPAVVAGTLLGRWLLGKMNQRVFENVALALTIAAGAKLLL
jgi:uncharacterized membrane protein YfcA